MPSRHMEGEGFEFVGSPAPTIGIEIEFQLLDPVTLDLADGILPLLHGYPEHPCIKPEFSQFSVEINSNVCRDVAELETDIRELTRLLRQRCDGLGLQLCAAGTHPFCQRPATVTPYGRYLEMERRAAYLSHTLKTFALQVHVGVRSGDLAMATMAEFKPYLPVFLALSASSPFWQGQDTGFASFRHRVLAAMRDYGLPPSFVDWRELVSFFDTLRTAGIAQSLRDVHWDIRPQPHFGTLEVRVMDAQPTLAESVRLAALVQTLIVFLQDSLQSGACLPVLLPRHWWLEKENCFRAAQLGIDADLVIDAQGRTQPIRGVIRDLLEMLGDTADRLNTRERLEALERESLCRDGPSYLRQRARFAETGSLPAVAAGLIRELKEELAEAAGA